MVRNQPASVGDVMQETWVPSLGQEDLLEKKMAIYSSILAWEIPWTEKPGGLLSMSCKKYNTHTHTQIHTIPLRFRDFFSLESLFMFRGIWDTTVLEEI